MSLGPYFDKECNIPLNIKYFELYSNNSYIINSLPDSIVELKLGDCFDLEILNLPTSLKKLVILNDNYKHNLNCLPNFIEELHLNRKYKKRILNIPPNLKKLICDKNYPYEHDFENRDVKIYNYC